MTELLKFATESLTNYFATLIMLLGIATLITAMANTIIKTLGTTIIGIVISSKSDFQYDVEQIDNDKK